MVQLLSERKTADDRILRREREAFHDTIDEAGPVPPSALHPCVPDVMMTDTLHFADLRGHSQIFRKANREDISGLIARRRLDRSEAVLLSWSPHRLIRPTPTYGTAGSFFQ